MVQLKRCKKQIVKLTKVRYSGVYLHGRQVKFFSWACIPSHQLMVASLLNLFSNLEACVEENEIYQTENIYREREREKRETNEQIYIGIL